MTNESASTPAAGWYPDPTDPGLHRLWDGRQWTEHTRLATESHPASPAAPLEPPQPRSHVSTERNRPEPPRSSGRGWSGGSMTGLGVTLLALLMVGGCVVGIGVVPLLAFRSSGEQFSGEPDFVEDMPVPTMTTGPPAVMDEADLEMSTTVPPGFPGAVPGGPLVVYGTPVEMPVWLDDDQQPMILDVLVGEPIDRTEEIVAANPLNPEPLPGVVHVGIPVTIVLREAATEPLPVEGMFDWQIVGGETFSVYRPTGASDGEFGCGALADNLTVTELRVNEEVTGTVCVAIPTADFDHADTRVVLTIGSSEPFTWSR